jgi:integrase
MRREQELPRSVGALIRSYLQSPGYVGLRDTTKKGYSSRIEALRTRHGHRAVAGLTRERINLKILQPYADRPGAALAILKMLRVLIRHAIDIGWLTFDPSVGIKRPRTAEIRSWTDAEIATFERRWPIGSQQRLAFALHLYTGQRRSDVHRIAWANVTDDSIHITQQKPRRRVTLKIPLHTELQRALAAARRDHAAILTTAFGMAFTVDGYSQWMRAAITAAGLPLECQPHGLRKAAGRHLANAGCSAHEIMSILGHRSLEEAERYTREAAQAPLAISAMAKREAHKPTIPPKPPHLGLGKSRISEGNQSYGKRMALPRGLEPRFSP